MPRVLLCCSVLHFFTHRTKQKLISNMLRSSIRPFYNVARRNFSGKELKFGVEGRALMLEGVNLLADAVQVYILIRILIHSLSLFHRLL